MGVAQWGRLMAMDAVFSPLNRDGDVPLGTQLAWQVQALIVNGRLRPGEQLPSVRRLADVAGGNGNTGRAVYERLGGGGVGAPQPGRGPLLGGNVPPGGPPRGPAPGDPRGGRPAR